MNSVGWKSAEYVTPQKIGSRQAARTTAAATARSRARSGKTICRLVVHAANIEDFDGPVTSEIAEGKVGLPTLKAESEKVSGYHTG